MTSRLQPAARRAPEGESAARPRLAPAVPAPTRARPALPTGRTLPPSTRERLEAAFASASKPPRGHGHPDPAEVAEVVDVASPETEMDETAVGEPAEAVERAPERDAGGDVDDAPDAGDAGAEWTTRARIVRRALAEATEAPDAPTVDPSEPAPAAAAASASEPGPVTEPEPEAELEPDEEAGLVVALDVAKRRASLRARVEAGAEATAAEGGEPELAVGPEGGRVIPLRPTVDAIEVDAPFRPVEAVARGPPELAPADRVIVQTKLAVSSPGDPLEREADAVAARVLRGGVPAPPQRGWAPSGAVRRAPAPARGPPPSARGERSLPRTVRSVVASPGGGSPLDASLRARIEPHVGVGLEHVRVRRGPDAAAAARDLGARAFTSGSTIFMAAESSPADVGLIAHEATHVAQQQTAPGARTTLMRDASDYLPDVSVTDVIPDWILDGVRTAVRAIPGYTLLTYVVGRDPLTDAPVSVTPLDMIETLLTYGPFGPAVGPVLQGIEVLGEIFTFVSESLAANNLTLARISRDVEAAWDELSVTNGVAGNVAIVRRYVDAFLRDVRNFVGTIVDRVIEIVRSVVADVAEPLLQTPEIAPVWNLAKKVMHYDPLRGTDVDAPTAEIIADFLRLIGEEERLAQMEERGTLQETADWLDTQFATFASLVGELGTLFSDAWAAIQPQNLPNLLTNLEDLARRAFGFVGRVADFAATVILKILELIKDALLGWLSEHAHSIPGFHLLTVILERNPFTGETVPRTAENLIKGFITLLPGGEETYNQLAESGVIGDAAARIEGEMTRLGISWDMVTGLFLGIWDTLTLDDLLDPIGAFNEILALFGDPLSRLVEFVGVVIEVVITLVLHLMNFPSDLLGRIIANTVQAIEDIKRDPVAFVKNMLAALKLGFTGFFDNITTYLVRGLQAWLFRGLGQLGITIPTDLSLQSIVTLVIQVLGLSIDALWRKLGQHIGQERVAMIRGAIDRLAGAWEFIKDVQENGISAVWRYVRDQLSNLWDTLLNMAKEWIVNTIITRVTAKLISMLDPTGIMAVVNSFIAFFNAVQSAIEYLRDILEIVNRYTETLAAVAAGNIVPGAQMLEQGLAAAIPVAIGFLANQVGLGNVPEKVVELIGRLRELVDRALDWLVAQAVRLGRAALNALGLGQQGDTPEDRKRAALEEVRGAMTRGIRRSELVTLLADLRTRLELRRCELVGESAVVVENSASETVQGELVFSQAEIEGATGVAHRLPGRRGGRDVVVGQFATTGETLPTVRGLLEPYRQEWASWGGAAEGVRVEWSPSLERLPGDARRPSRITASLRGVLDIRVTDVPRESGVTGVVGDMGDLEHAVRNRLDESRKNFVGGHVIAHELGGPESFDNLVPMRTKLNDPIYAGVEDFLVNNVMTIRPGRDPEEFPVSAELTFDMSYPGAATARIAQLAHMVATEIGPGVRMAALGPAERDAAIAAMEERRRALRASIGAVRGRPLVIPARIPTTISLHARFTSEPREGAPPSTVSRPGITRTLDPVIMIAGPAGAAPPAPAGAAPAPAPSTGPWEHTWTFTQST